VFAQGGVRGAARVRAVVSLHIMSPEQKDVCHCGLLENASREPGSAIRWDERMNEYHIVDANGGELMVYYCPFCGGRTPKSQRSSFFAHVTQHEEQRITELFRDIRKVADVIARFGPPDEEREVAFGVRSPVRDDAPQQGEVFRGLVYKKLSPVADVVFQIGDSDTVRGTWIQKYVGEKNEAG
jgi:Domain of unknown function (DUF6980)